MGIIQQALNQAMTTIGVAARLSPEYEAKIVEAAQKQSFKRFEALAEADHGGEEYQEEKVKRLEEIAKTRATKKNIEALNRAEKKLADEKKSVFEAKQKRQKQEEANRRAAQAQEEQKQQKERYDAFVNVFTEGGLYK